ncbi:MAG: GTPase [Spirulina sp. SIO3F2]|nr:GTPase [Spirulina sp. SIO3F2]
MTRYFKAAKRRIEDAKHKKLETLNLSSLGLYDISLQLTQLTDLTDLDLSGNILMSLPPELGQLKNLKWLYLSGNELASLPSELGQLVSLIGLYISGNELKKLPPELGYLANLTELDLYGNGLTGLPPELGRLTKLNKFDLSGNQLVDLPPELGQLMSLTQLDLSRNRLKSLPPELGQLINLEWLYLYRNRLNTLPPELGQLMNLTGLHVSGNELTSLPPKLGQLTNLTELDLSRNRLKIVPPELGQLRNLTKLDLYGNRLTTLSSELGQLRNLTKLDIYGNKLKDLPPELGQLTNLTELDLSSNELKSLPPELGQLTKLKKLDLYGNELKNLPSKLGQLKNLEWLDLSKNGLTSLPPELGQLPNLTWLNLYGNRLMSFPPEIVQQGTKAILAYLREQQQESGEPQWLSKLLVVGEGGVGKTSLLSSLRGESFKSQEPSTHGIEIKSLELAHPSGVNVMMRLNTWDFGGQEIYHATHQFFLTNRSLFLLAFNARLGFEQGKLVYWLKTIRANAPESPIILVATWADERDADLPLSDLKQQFPQILDLYEVSNKTKTGIRELRKIITDVAAALPLMGEVWPSSWLKFANTMRQIDTKYTTPKSFWAAMDKCKVSKEGQPILANWLHELGDILFFQDDEEVDNLVILKPQWVTEYISKVLTAEEVIKSNGIFTRQCMDQVWEDLKPSLRDFFLRLMERFDLSYRTLEDRDISLVVERLPFEPNYQSLWEQKQEEINCREISMKFQVSEILPGIPTWFIARQHRFTIEQGERKGIHWRTGVLFQDFEGKHLGLVRTLRDDKTNANYLHLSVRGPVPHNFFSVLRNGLELTLRRYPGLEVTRLLPCPDPIQISCLHEFDYANLYKRLERTPPKEDIECPNCLENISVNQLLFGIHYTTQNAVIAKIDELQASKRKGLDTLQDSTEQDFTEFRELIQRDILRDIRAVQKQLESPCPSVFVLRPDDRSVWQKDIGSERINLQLYCEHPGCFHPVQDGGLYAIDNPKQWLKVMAPHINRLFGILKYVTPVVGPWLNVTVPDYSELIAKDLKLTAALVNKLPKASFTDDDHSFIDDRYPSASVHKISGSALRTLHQFLKQKDPQQVWGGLNRVVTPEGDVLWLCDTHKKEIYPTAR